MATLIHRPDGPLAEGAVQLSSTTPVLSGGRIGVLDNGKPNARLLLTRAAEGLAGRIGGHLATVTGKGAGANAATSCTSQVLETLSKEVELYKVVDTPRRARTSIGRAGEDQLDLLTEGLQDLGATSGCCVGPRPLTGDAG